jgi:hypothetical protein
MADSLLHEDVRRQRAELWPIFGSSIVTVFEVTERLFQAVYVEKYRCTAHLIIQKTVPL